MKETKRPGLLEDVHAARITLLIVVLGYIAVMSVYLTVKHRW